MSLLLITILLVSIPAISAFGAGDIPDFAYLNDKAFRHGDIENVLENVLKSAGAAAAGGGLLGFAKQMVDKASGGSKFSKSDIKKIYFGNWLRDYSQAMDIAGLKKLSADSIVLVISVLGFMTFGFATDEFEVTAERLGVYLPTEHIDNPKGYAAIEGDAREYHPKLRAPVDDRELEIDERTGMKNYMATDGQGWDTSTALIRRTLEQCIRHGQAARGQEGHDLFEAYRLLGTALHTLEDLLAHSNWCEVGLRKMGHSEVFCHVGDDVYVTAPGGEQVPPLVTGTFGGADFMHSVLGEATDKLSQASVTALSDKMSSASAGDNEKINALKSIISKLPTGGKADDKLNQGEQMHQAAQGYDVDMNNLASPEILQQCRDILNWHDDVFRDINKKIENIPGLENLVDELSNALNEYCFTLINPYLQPILSQVTQVLGEGSKTVIDSDDQYEVFNNPRASDPSHSMLSKDHFALSLNEPAGKIAQVIVVYTVELIVQAWNGDGSPDRVIDQVLEVFHHPYYANGSPIQEKMFNTLQAWFNGLDDQRQIISSLTKESVKNHQNKRPGAEEYAAEAGYHGHSHGASTAGSNRRTGAGDQYGGQPKLSSGNQEGNAYSSGRRTGEQSSYSQTQRDDNNTYGSGRRAEEPSYGSTRRAEEQTWGQTRHDEDNSYSSGRRNEEQSSYGQTRRDDDNIYGSGRKTEEQSSYGQTRHDDDNTYGSGRRTEEQTSYGQTRHDDDSTYSSSRRTEEHTSYGQTRRDDDNTYGSSRRTEEQSSYGQTRGDDYDSGRRAQELSYGSSRHEEQQSYGGTRHDDSYGEQGGRHHGGAATRHQDNDDTFGAERLDLGEHGREHRGGREEYGGRGSRGEGGERHHRGHDDEDNEHEGYGRNRY